MRDIGGGLLGQPLLECLVEAFDLAAGLGVVGPGVLDGDAQGQEFEFERGGAVAGLGGEDGVVVGEY